MLKFRGSTPNLGVEPLFVTFLSLFSFDKKSYKAYYKNTTINK